jgi:DNA repair protein RecO (recombination protein O)
MAVQKTYAFVLRSIDWKETSKITGLFTRDFGKVNVIAKGARRSNSRYRGLLESLNLIEVVIYFSPKRDLQTLGDISLDSSFNRIRGDLQKTGYALGILELVDIFFPYGNPDTAFFDFCKNIFYTLEVSSDDLVIFWYFLLKIASYLGFKPEFTICRKCSNSAVNHETYFSMSEGSVICAHCIKTGENLIKLSKVDIDNLLYIQNFSYKNLSAIRAIAPAQMNYTNFLLHYIQFHTDQKLELRGLKLLGN